ncbi:alcohol dehydrogenase catalytic domain-containing protein [Pelagibacteraceae bacterium]|jgi:threonine dehydrogenase-like Zn-dependent dehydrogenase|nr:alcohol dehydrogenase catalytic domain-containing protein [Pelagibacteraceae bacterium]|tara:strand:+ start:653 stop:1657 length:1005 start_codon:yes stop_codon:yes gene_type:complete
MKALVYTGIQELVYREEKNPKQVTGESIIKVKASGICGSDMHAYHGKDERRTPPLILGHEVSGVIQSGKFKDKVVVLNPLIACDNCYYCKNGREHLCPERTMVGMSKPNQKEGGLAEFISIPNKNIFMLPKELNIEEAALTEPTAVCVHAVLLSEESSKKPLSECKVLIQGAGAIGLLCGLILNKQKKCKNLTMSDPNKLRLEECSKYLDAKFVEPQSKSLEENKFDIIFDTVGLEVSRAQAIHTISPGGVIVHVGLTQPEGNFNFRKLTIQEITVIGTYCYTNKDFKKSIKILKEQELGSLKWIEFRELRNGSEAFKQIHDGTCVAPKIILIP